MFSVLRVIVILAGVWVASAANAAGPSVNVDMPAIDPKNQASLQRGAKYFMNYCSGCHSLQYLRFNRMAKEIGITGANGEILEDILKKNLMFGDQKIGDAITIAMTPEEATKWFGVAPPDLTLEARLRGPEWVYAFLTSFYADPAAQWGVNNWIYPGTAMPNILGALQGVQQPVYKTQEVHTDGGTFYEKTVVGVEQVTPGALTPEEFDAMVYDIVNFLAYAAEPGKLQRYRVGVFVLLFIVIFGLFAYLLKREYWKDVHKS